MNDIPSLVYIGSFILMLIAQSVFLTWIVNETGGSVLMASLNHYAVNISTGLAVSVFGLITMDALSVMMSLSYLGLAIVISLLYR